MNQEINFMFYDANKKKHVITLFDNYLWQKKHYADRYDYPQEDISHKFEYECYARKDLYKEITQEEKSHVTMTLIF